MTLVATDTALGRAVLMAALIALGSDTVDLEDEEDDESESDDTAAFFAATPPSWIESKNHK